MDVTEDTVRDVCTDAVFERGERYRDEGRIHEIHRVDSTVTAVVSGSRQYDVRVDLTTDGFAPWCDCPYDGPGACKHVVAVLLRCVDDRPPDEGDQLDAALNSAGAGELRAFLREELAIDTNLRARFLARVGEPTRQSADELRTLINRRFEETNPEYDVVFEPVDFTQWFDLADEYREQDRYASAATVYRVLIESLDDNMERVDGAYDHFSSAFSRALNGYVDCVAAAERDADAVTDAVAFLNERAMSGTPFLAEHFEKAAVELRETAGEQSCE
ncbi:SWIM zinc finger family protein [Halobellus sp. H-GB7]|uniref:SWIM zinc finger family protein n=1 Tax=Halobellus sp. H-GB7 TaxID=3069756 RepID=UPI0027B287C5|nr:SWIM zinc finger family protein [Halobellus sp. H-GB7]MDQ2055993.1 SWIM zinc finger domain-containing protein [Halobellus sp. H-GB7]